MGAQLVSLLLVLQLAATATPKLEKNDYTLLREGDPAPFAGLLLLDGDYRELKLKESELKISLERLEVSEKSYRKMKVVAEECAAELDEISDGSPAWYESFEFWLGAVIGAGLTIATVLTVEELK